MIQLELILLTAGFGFFMVFELLTLLIALGLIALACGAFPSGATSQVVFETRALRLEIAEDGVVRSLQALHAGDH